MNATELLQDQHREVEKLLEQIRSGGAQGNKALREELCAMIVAHMVAEEDHFYPTLRGTAPELVDIAMEEHGLMHYEVGRILSATRSDAHLEEAKLKVLADILMQHVRMEEEELFSRANSLSQERLEELGEQMQERFEQVKAMSHRRLVAMNSPKTPTRAMPKKAAPQRSAPKASKKHAPERPATRRTTARSAATRSATTRSASARSAKPTSSNGRKTAKTSRPGRPRTSGSSRSRSAS